MKAQDPYRAIDVLGWHLATGRGSWQPGIVALVKHCGNGLRLNFGERFFIVCWPARRELNGKQPL